ncbi:MAG: S8 family peptidase [Phycisphaerales bacterium]|nr:S8 family peptidase [Phycisphaerales bacterium]
MKTLARTPSVRTASAVLVLMLLAGTAHGQDVLFGNGFPGNWTNPNGAGNPTALPNSFTSGNSAGLGFDNATIGESYSSVRLAAGGRSTEDRAGNADRFNIQMVAHQDFRLANRGPGTGVNLWAPSFFAGAVSFFQNAAAPNANLADVRLFGRIEFQRFDGVNYVSMAAPQRIDFTYNRTAAQGNGNINQTQFLHLNDPDNTLPVADRGVNSRYRLRAFLEVGVNASPVGAVGAARSDIGSGATGSMFPVLPETTVQELSKGLFTSLGYAPSEALPNSRAAVGAVQAKSEFNLDGSNIRIGQVEAGRAWQTHAALSGAGKIDQLRQRLDLPSGLLNPANPAGPGNPFLTDSRSEHATAVAGIMAGAVGNAEQRGIAHNASIVAAPIDAFGNGRNAFDAVALDPTVQVVNMSAGPATPSPEYVDSVINTRRNLIFVKSAGNSGQGGAPGNPANTITNPGMSYNGLAVGALNATFSAIASFSSSNATPGTLRKPDLVAPGEYILTPMAIDTNNDGMANDFDRRFTGVDARVFADVDSSTSRTGAISGTSFAAPHVAGVAALLSQAQREDRGGVFDATSNDSRVVKAVLLNTATRGVIRDSAGAGWSQRTTPLPGPNQGYTVTESLDRQLGAGMVNALGAAKNYLAGEALDTDTNTLSQHNISAPTNPAGGLKTQWWDLERVQGRADLGPPAPGQALVNGTVNYALPTHATLTPPPPVTPNGPTIGTFRPMFPGLKAALTWNALTNAAGTTYDPLANLELRLYAEDPVSAINRLTFSPDLTVAKLLYTTANINENTKVFDLDGLINDRYTYSAILPSVGDLLAWQPRFFLQVVYTGGGQAGQFIDYGLSVIVPAPTTATLLAVLGLCAARRRRS